MPHAWIIEINNVSYSYPTKASVLNDINLKVKRRELLGIIGPSGAGKSTLCKVFNGLVPKYYGGEFKGEAIVCGLDTIETDMTEICTKVGLVFQNPEEQLSGVCSRVDDEVGFGLSMLGFCRDEIKKRRSEALKKVGLEGFDERSPYTLSGGELQRVAIATMLTVKPEVIVLDEPTAQLDPVGKFEVFKVIKDLNKEKLTTIVVEQEIEELATFADRIIALYNGRIVFEGEAHEVLGKVDELKEIGVDPPSVTELTYLYFNKYGISRKDYPIKLSEALDLFNDLLRKGK